MVTHNPFTKCPATCCGMLCEELPATLTATIEVFDCDCQCVSSNELTLTKEPCDPGNELGTWRYSPVPPPEVCPTATHWVQIESLELRCGDEGSGSGSGAVADFSLDFAPAVLVGMTLIEGECDPLVLVFEDDLGVCQERFPGDPNADLNCRVRVTITL